VKLTDPKKALKNLIEKTPVSLPASEERMKRLLQVQEAAKRAAATAQSEKAQRYRRS
jgi:hypothetical protein